MAFNLTDDKTRGFDLMSNVIRNEKEGVENG